MYYLNDAENELHYHGYKRAVLVAVLAVGAAFFAVVAAAAVAAGPIKRICYYMIYAMGGPHIADDLKKILFKFSHFSNHIIIF